MIKRFVVEVHFSVNVHSSNVVREVVDSGEIFMIHLTELGMIEIEDRLLIIGRSANNSRAEMIIE